VGNTVVWKPAEPCFTARRLVELFVEAGVPAGVMNMVNGTGSEIGDELVGSPAVRAIRNSSATTSE